MISCARPLPQFPPQRSAPRNDHPRQCDRAVPLLLSISRLGGRALRHHQRAPSRRPSAACSVLQPRGCAGAGEVVVSIRIDLAPTTISAFRSTAQVREGQGQAKPAPHCDVHEVRCEGGRRIRKVSRPATYPHADRIEQGSGGRSQGRKQRAFSKGSVKCQNGMSLPTRASEAEFTLSRWDVSASGARFPVGSAHRRALTGSVHAFRLGPARAFRKAPLSKSISVVQK